MVGAFPAKESSIGYKNIQGNSLVWGFLVGWFSFVGNAGSDCENGVISKF